MFFLVLVLALALLSLIVGISSAIGLISGGLQILDAIKSFSGPAAKRTFLQRVLIIALVLTVIFTIVAIPSFISVVPSPKPHPSPSSSNPPANIPTTPAAQVTATSVNPIPTPSSGIDTLTDDFNSGSVLDNTKWMIYTTHGATIAVSRGQQVNTPAHNVISEATTRSIKLYSLIGKSASIQVLQISAGSTVNTAFGLQNPDASAAIQIFYSGGNLVVGTYGSERVPITTYNSTTQKWWRIRESGGTTYADVSSDGITWANIYKHANFFDMSQVRVFTTSDEWDADPTAGAAKFDNFNLN